MNKQTAIFKYHCFKPNTRVLFFHNIYNEMFWGTIVKVLRNDNFKACAIVIFEHEGIEQQYEIQLEREDYCLEQMINYKKESVLYKSNISTCLNNMNIGTPLSLVTINIALFSSIKLLNDAEEVKQFLNDERCSVIRLSKKNIKIEKQETVYNRQYTVTTARGVALNSQGTHFINMSEKIIWENNWFITELFNLHIEMKDKKFKTVLLRNEFLFIKINKIVDKFHEGCFEEAEKYYNKFL